MQTFRRRSRVRFGRVLQGFGGSGRVFAWVSSSKDFLTSILEQRKNSIPAVPASPQPPRHGPRRWTFWWQGSPVNPSRPWALSRPSRTTKACFFERSSEFAGLNSTNVDVFGSFVSLDFFRTGHRANFFDLLLPPTFGPNQSWLTSGPFSRAFPSPVAFGPASGTSGLVLLALAQVLNASKAKSFLLENVPGSRGVTKSFTLSLSLSLPVKDPWT